ncbi:hypothetical protein [Nocardia sp. NBC_01329]|uniref:hypothetical protein n=1 Tax=Nocardia sp. NBC_01329 TaxID=2903594 RepID=UPI002E164F80|nr:hypothetical protein OG405_18955 [Nocardia sp. NBC_01329]
MDAAGYARIHCRGGTIAVRNPCIVEPRRATTDVPHLARLGNRVAGIIVFGIG